MTNQYTQEPAFPVTNKVLIGHAPDSTPIYQEDTYFGMSLRDYFAAAALTGMLSDPECNPTPEECALRAYKMATAMLAQRARG